MHGEMLAKWSTLLVIVCLWKTGLCVQTMGSLFSKGGTYATAGSRPDYTATVDSEILCAVQCYSDEQCATFEYNNDTKFCRMSAGLLSGAKYGPHVANGLCPAGYEVFVRDKNVLCLKYYSNEVTQIQATSQCGKDGSRLVLIQNKSMLYFVVDILKDRTWGQVWINGFDADNDFNFMTSDGQPLPYVPPGSYLNESGQLCVRVTLDHKFHDLPCSGPAIRKVMCEIVV